MLGVLVLVCGLVPFFVGFFVWNALKNNSADGADDPPPPPDPGLPRPTPPPLPHRAFDRDPTARFTSRPRRLRVRTP